MRTDSDIPVAYSVLARCDNERANVRELYVRIFATMDAIRDP